jgi:hypothetical protein
MNLTRRLRTGALAGALSAMAGLAPTDAAAQGCEPAGTRQADAGAMHDVLIRNGTIYDGSGGTPFRGDVAIDGDRIAVIGDLADAEGRVEIDAAGLAVAPGFINMLSWATEPLIEDGRSQSDIRQGVTLEVFGEGYSMGPLNDATKKELVDEQGDIKYEVEWTTLGEYLEHLVRRGISQNVASFLGAVTPACTCSGTSAGIPHPRSWPACARSCGRPCRRARSASAPRGGPGATRGRGSERQNVARVSYVPTIRQGAHSFSTSNLTFLMDKSPRVA